MTEEFRSIIYRLIKPAEEEINFSIFDPVKQFNEKRTDDAGIAQSLNASFFIALSGQMNPEGKCARDFLARMTDSFLWGDIAKFITIGLDLVHKEIKKVCEDDPDFSNRMKSLNNWMSYKENAEDIEETKEKIWSVFFPEANGIAAHKNEYINKLREKRTITILRLNDVPIENPMRQVLFTSNVLLTVPPKSKPIEELSLSRAIKENLKKTIHEPQTFFFDHPNQIGIELEKNEILYGLKGLEEAIEFEKEILSIQKDEKGTCLLSVSVTHPGLREIAKTYLKEIFIHSDVPKNIDVYVFTEDDTEKIIKEILSPAALRYLKRGDAKEDLSVFGVDGEYARHYSFLKAIAAFWNVLVQPEIKATFKIDLDQVFPQKELLEQTGATAFEHLKTPLWGAKAIDADGQHIELGMIAGALVNQRDIHKSLFTPDVSFPENILSPDEYIFYSVLPQALSTEAEMMTRYKTSNLDGIRKCIQRIHVTGGTNGILVDSLRRYRPFTPSFIARAEDQAYILSTFSRPGANLRYVHKNGLIMRHDKEEFAQDAIKSAYIDKLIGDYVRIILLSSYAKVVNDDIEGLKNLIDPFTGCFISKIPVTIVFLRFCLKAASLFDQGKNEQGLDFLKRGSRQIMKSLNFANNEKSMLKQHVQKERMGWDLYYDTLSAIEEALKDKDPFAIELQKKAKSIIYKQRIG